MIEVCKEFVTENPVKQVWKLLRQFLDIDYVVEEIIQTHKITDNKQKPNITKQAVQIGYCIRQAEEYFHAADQVDLATKPNLLYYGAVSLSQALVLLKQNGELSLDMRRMMNTHKHHGLELLGTPITKGISNIGIEEFFNSIECKCHINGDKPWGQFSVFYQSLISNVYFIDHEIIKRGRKVSFHNKLTADCADVKCIKFILQTKFQMMELIKTLPDMFFLLNELDIEPSIYRGDVKSKIEANYDNDVEGEKTTLQSKSTFQLFINGIKPDMQDFLINYYQKVIPQIQLVEKNGNIIAFNLIIESGPDDPISYSFPDIVDDLNGRKYYIGNPDEYIIEPAAHFIILFCLGMICRYYPDVWMKAIDQNVRVAEFSDALLDMIYRKFPNLILDQMTEAKYYIHL